MTLSLALDLGSTRIKAARLDRRGKLAELISEPAPPLRGEGLVREGDAEEYRRATESVLARATEGLGADVPLGIASQRSSFLLWDRESGLPVTSLISWQDRRAADWCRRHRDLEGRVRDRTGLPLSPHYLGPKLASMFEVDAGLARRLEDGALRLGTLETYLAGRWSGGRELRTDPTMAARTLLYDLRAGDWAEDLLSRFGATREALAPVRPSAERGPLLPGRGWLTATIADQAASALGAAGREMDVALVNFGTGCFVLRPTGPLLLDRPGYLVGPMLALGDDVHHCLEGTINGGAASVDRFGPGPTALPGQDPTPGAFCLPDSAGVGAPHWRANRSFTLSEAAGTLSGNGKRRVVLEGLLFRVCEILEDLFPDRQPRAVLLAGGLAREPFLAQGLAACLARDVEVLHEREGTLLGVARLAAGLQEAGRSASRLVPPPRGGGYLPQKFERWKSWLAGVLA